MAGIAVEIKAGNSGTPAWYDNGWAYRKTVTIDYTKVGAALTDFPVLISTTDTNLRDYAQSDADDILFTSSNGTTKLSHELETYTSGTGALVAWVKIPTLSNTANTVLYLYYGNSTAADQQNATNVWDANHKAVWHLKEDPSGAAPQMRDSTANANHGTSAGSMTSGDQVAGKVNGSLDLDGNDDKLTVSYNSGLDITTALTAEAWIKSSDANGGIAGKIDGSLTGYILAMGGASGNGKISYWNGSQWYYSDSTVNDNNWHHVAVVHSGTTAYFYKNGVANGSAEAGSRTGNGSVDMWIGIDNSGCTTYLAGILDEIRLSNTARSAAWIQTSYNNQSSPSTFYAVGSESGAIPAVVFATAASRVAEVSSPAYVSVVLSTNSNNTISIDYAATGGSATGGGVDYTLANGTLTFSAGETNKTLSITLVDDRVLEYNETILVTLSNPTNANLGSPCLHTLTLVDPPVAYPDSLTVVSNTVADIPFFQLLLNDVYYGGDALTVSGVTSPTAGSSLVPRSHPYGRVGSPRAWRLIASIAGAKMAALTPLTHDALDASRRSDPSVPLPHHAAGDDRAGHDRFRLGRLADLSP